MHDGYKGRKSSRLGGNRCEDIRRRIVERSRPHPLFRSFDDIAEIFFCKGADDVIDTRIVFFERCKKAFGHTAGNHKRKRLCTVADKSLSLFERFRFCAGRLLPQSFQTRVPAEPAEYAVFGRRAHRTGIDNRDVGDLRVFGFLPSARDKQPFDRRGLGDIHLTSVCFKKVCHISFHFNFFALPSAAPLRYAGIGVRTCFASSFDIHKFQKNMSFAFHFNFFCLAFGR